MKVHLLAPPGGHSAQRWSGGVSMPPLGLLYIGAVLEREGIEIKITPADVWKWSWRRISREIQDFSPDVIGVSSTTENRFQSFKLIRTAKKAQPRALTLMGGPHASLAAEDTLAHLPELDAVVRGEGEMTTLEVCRALEKGKKGLEDIAGISWRIDGHIRNNPSRPQIQNLDHLPYPAFHLVPYEQYNFSLEVPGWGTFPAVNMITSRGCPFCCNFCATPVHWGGEVRMRSPKNVVDEIESLKQKYGVRVIYFFDDTFNADPGRVTEICNLLIERKLGLFWKCDVRVDLMDRPLLKKMKQAGLFHLSFGLEAGSERIRNDVIGKKIDVNDFHDLIRQCQELNIIPNPFFIFSHPTETWEEAEKTIDIIETYQDKIESSIALLHVYPGTPLETEARRSGVLPRDFSWGQKYHSQVITLPAAQGNVPLYQDRLSWSQISELVFRWAFGGGSYPLSRKMASLLTSLRSWGILKRYAIMAFIYLKLKANQFLKKPSPSSKTG